MEKVVKGMLTVLLVLYVLSPIDALPGPIDDLIVVLAGLAARRKMGNGTGKNSDTRISTGGSNNETRI